MTNLGSLLHSPGTQPFDVTEEKAAQLLELRMETGAVYARPSNWQRIRLQWIFRNFHVLSAQVLSQWDRRLIDRLAQSSVVTPDLPVPTATILGVIERVQTRSEAVAEPACRPVGDRKRWNVSLGQLGALTAICVTVLLASALASRTPPARNAPASPVSTHNLGPVVPTGAKRSGGTCCAPSRVTTLHNAPPLASLPSRPTRSEVEEPARQVTKLSPDLFAHPVVTQGNGEVRLKVLIGTDGSVKTVTVLRGDPRFAEAGARAVRHWHYRPYEELGQPVETETEVTMKFFGPDAVSIASVSNQSISVLR